MTLISLHLEVSPNRIPLYRELLILMCLLLPLVGRGQVDTLKILEPTTTMKEVVVKASKILVVQKGDTLVYNADLLQLAESAMLKELIQALPDAQIDLEGHITVKGEPIHELLVEGRDFFNGDNKIALENLPAFTVQKVKVYRKVPFDAYLTRKDRGKRALESDPMVMNVRLKAKYQNGFIGNTQLAGGIPTQGDADLLYLWHIFGMHYNRHRSLGVNMNTNNVNDAGRALSDGAWSSNVREDGEIKNTIGKVDYSYTNPENRRQVTSSLRLTHRDQYSEQKTSSMQYPTDGKLYSTSSSDLNGRSLNAAWNGKYMYPSRTFTMQLMPQIDYAHNRSLSCNRSAAFSEQLFSDRLGNVIDSLFNKDMLSWELDSQLIHRQVINTEGIFDNFNVGVSSMLTIRVPFLKQALLIKSEGNFTLFNSRQHTTNQMFYAIRQNDENKEQYCTNHSQQSNFNIDISNVLFSRSRNSSHAEISAAYRLNYSQSNRDNGLYDLHRLTSWNHSFDWNNLPDEDALYSVRDEHNSSDVVETGVWNQLSLNGSFDFSRTLRIRSSVPLQLKYRNIIDVRGHEELSLSRNDWLIQPSFSVQYKDFSIRYHLKQLVPSMHNLLERTEDSDPMSVNIGNSALKNSIQHSLSLNIGKSFNKSAFISASIEYDYFKNAIKSMGYLDLKTGKTTIQRRNVDGDWMSRLNFSYRQTFGKSGRWQLNSSLLGEVGQEGVYDHLGAVEAPVSHTATRGQIYFNLDLAYQDANLRIAVKCSNRWNHTESLQRFFHTNYYDFLNGVAVKALLWRRIHVDSDIMMRLKRGAENTVFNQDNIIWNILLSSDITAHWTLKAEGFDILRQLSSTSASSSATGWSVCQRNVLSSYCMLHVTYRFNILPK